MSKKNIIQKSFAPIQAFIALEASSGIILLIVTAIALIWANSASYETYLHFIEMKIPIGIAPIQMTGSLHHWVNDGLMVIFFFVVGMEIKRELAVGALSTLKKASLPIFAAVGGMVAPALIYTFFNFKGEGHSGWGIPMATDIAFAVGVLALMSKKVPPALKVFLLALAIADDLGAVLVIAIFYTEQISFSALGVAAFGVGLVTLLQITGIRRIWVYWVLGIFIWFFVLSSGVHATVAGVVLGLLTPLKAVGDEAVGPLERLVHGLHPWVSFGIMPIFAFVNAGVHLPGDLPFQDLIAHPITLGVLLGLFIGKPFGILLFSYLGCKTGIAQMPDGVNWRQLTSVGFLAGIGFTMALFISHLALKSPDVEVFSKMGIMMGSVVSAVCGLILLATLKNQDVR